MLPVRGEDWRKTVAAERLRVALRSIASGTTRRCASRGAGRDESRANRNDARPGPAGDCANPPGRSLPPRGPDTGSVSRRGPSGNARFGDPECATRRVEGLLTPYAALVRARVPAHARDEVVGGSPPPPPEAGQRRPRSRRAEAVVGSCRRRPHRARGPRASLRTRVRRGASGPEGILAEARFARRSRAFTPAHQSSRNVSSPSANCHACGGGGDMRGRTAVSAAQGLCRASCAGCGRRAPPSLRAANSGFPNPISASVSAIPHSAFRL